MIQSGVPDGDREAGLGVLKQGRRLEYITKEARLKLRRREPQPEYPRAQTSKLAYAISFIRGGSKVQVGGRGGEGRALGGLLYEKTI